MLTQITLEAWERSQNVRQERPTGQPVLLKHHCEPLRRTSGYHARHQPEDNRDLAAAQQLSAGLAQLVQLTGNGRRCAKPLCACSPSSPARRCPSRR